MKSDTAQFQKNYSAYLRRGELYLVVWGSGSCRKKPVERRITEYIRESLMASFCYGKGTFVNSLLILHQSIHLNLYQHLRINQPTHLHHCSHRSNLTKEFTMSLAN